MHACVRGVARQEDSARGYMGLVCYLQCMLPRLFMLPRVLDVVAACTCDHPEHLLALRARHSVGFRHPLNALRCTTLGNFADHNARQGKGEEPPPLPPPKEKRVHNVARGGGVAVIPVVCDAWREERCGSVVFGFVFWLCLLQQLESGGWGVTPVLGGAAHIAAPCPRCCTLVVVLACGWDAAPSC